MAKKKSKQPSRIEAGSVLDYLRTAPAPLLEAFELTHLNNVAILRKQLIAILDQMIRETAEASLARILIDNRRHLLQKPPQPEKFMERISEVVQSFPNLNFKELKGIHESFHPRDEEPDSPETKR